MQLGWLQRLAEAHLALLRGNVALVMVARTTSNQPRTARWMSLDSTLGLGNQLPRWSRTPLKSLRLTSLWAVQILIIETAMNLPLLYNKVSIRISTTFFSRTSYTYRRRRVCPALVARRTGKSKQGQRSSLVTHRAESWPKVWFQSIPSILQTVRGYVPSNRCSSFREFHPRNFISCLNNQRIASRGRCVKCRGRRRRRDRSVRESCFNSPRRCTAWPKQSTSGQMNSFTTLATSINSP